MVKSRALAALALAGAVALAGCSTPSNAPSDYDAQTRDNFLLACTRSAPESGDYDEDTETLPASACECRYDWFTENIPFGDTQRDEMEGYDGPTFQSLNDDAGNDEALPATVVDGLAAACGDGGGDAETTSTDTDEG